LRWRPGGGENLSVEAARLLFWVVASLLMAAAMASALGGVASIRAGRMAAHRVAMNRAVLLVATFLLAYAIKVAWLGHEPLTTWSGERLTVLQVHRSIVFTMLGAGAMARVLGPRAVAAARDSTIRRVHRWLGRVATCSGVAGLLTAIGVLLQMVRAAGGG